MTTSPPELPPGPPPPAAAGRGPGAERRLHPAGIAVASAGSIRDLLLPLVLVVVVGANRGGITSTLLLAAAGLVAAITLGIVRWATTSYRVVPDRIALRTGLLSPTEQLVPRSRISAIDTVQGPIQRVFGVVELRVQAAGGGSAAEITLGAVSHAEAQEIRDVLGQRARREAPDAAWRLSPRALVLAALTGPQVSVLLPLLAGAAALAQDVAGGGVQEEDVGRLLPETAGGIALAAAVLALAALLLSVGAAILVFGGFEVRREDRRLRIRRGVLQRRAAVIPLSRIHGVRIVENPVRQLLGVASVRIETIAHGGQDAAEQTLLPVVRRERVAATVAALVPGLPVGGEALTPPPPRARRRYATPPALAGLAAGALLTVAIPAAWAALPLLTLAGGAYGLLRHHDAGWALDRDRVTLRSRALSRTTLVARTARLQAEDLRVTPFQRRAGLATFGVVVARGARARIAHLEDAIARSLFERLREPPAVAAEPAAAGATRAS